MNKEYVQYLGTVGRKLHLDKLPGASNIYNELMSESTESWLKKEEWPIKKLEIEGYTSCLPPKYYKKYKENVGEDHVRNCMAEKVENGDTVVDIGGHVGRAMITLRRLVGESGSVTVFEPLPPYVFYLNRTIEENGFQNISVEEMVVSDHSGPMEVHVPYPETSQAGIKNNKFTSDKIITTESITLSKYIQENELGIIDFAKIDVEGGEYEIINNSNALEHIDTLILELHHNKIENRKIDNMISELQMKGEIYDLSGDNLSIEKIRINEDNTSHLLWEASR